MVANETKQSQELAKRLWAIANDLRGNMNAAQSFRITFWVSSSIAIYQSILRTIWMTS